MASVNCSVKKGSVHDKKQEDEMGARLLRH